MTEIENELEEFLANASFVKLSVKTHNEPITLRADAGLPEEEDGRLLTDLVERAVFIWLPVRLKSKSSWRRGILHYL